MSAIDFPNSPSIGDVFVAGTNLWEFDGVKWVGLRFGAPDEGLIDGGASPGSSGIRIFSGGSPLSTFTLNSIDCGSLA